jgi:hypothetical protein
MRSPAARGICTGAAERWQLTAHQSPRGGGCLPTDAHFGEAA